MTYLMGLTLFVCRSLLLKGLIPLLDLAGLNDFLLMRGTEHRNDRTWRDL